MTRPWEQTMSGPDTGDSPAQPEPVSPSRASGQHDLLEHPGRREIVDLLQRSPGLNKNSLAEAMGEYPNTIEYHLQKLVDAELVIVLDGEQGREKVCFLQGQDGLWEDDRTRILFGRQPVRQVALYIAEHPGATSREIAQAVGLSPVTVRHHLDTLSSYDLIDRQRAGRSFRYQADPHLDAWVHEVGDGYERRWDPK